MSHLFIAHGPRDIDPLLRVHEAMRQASIPTWYAPPDDENEDDQKQYETAIDNAFAMVVLVSASSIRSGAVQAQLKRAVERNLTLLPIRADNGRLSRLFKSSLADKLTDSLVDDGALDRLVTAARDRYMRKCPVVSVMNLKGGVGKTTVSSQVFGSWQANLGGRVLMIDLDPQYNLTQTFFDMETADLSSARDQSVISLFERSKLHAADAPSPGENWNVISVDPFATAQPHLASHQLLRGEDAPPGRLDLISGQFEISKYAFSNDALALRSVEENFKRAIDFYRSFYDLIIFDTNPNATFLTRCTLEAADHVVAPMHSDIYSLRGVRLLNQVVQEHVKPESRPDISVLFNMVGRSEQSDFEADARNGAFDSLAGFDLSATILKNALPRSGHLIVRAPDQDTAPWTQFIAHHGRGGGLKRMRQSLTAVATELKSKLDA